jgi:hypothetical protein
MPLANAQTLIPALGVSETEPDADATALTQLAVWCLRYAPLVAADGPDGIWIYATGCTHLAGGEKVLLTDLVGRLCRSTATRYRSPRAERRSRQLVTVGRRSPVTGPQAAWVTDQRPRQHPLRREAQLGADPPDRVCPHCPGHLSRGHRAPMSAVGFEGG